MKGLLNMPLIGGITLAKIISVIILAIVCLFIAKRLIKVFDRILERSHIDHNLHSFLHTVAQIALYFVVVLILADSVGIPITTLIAAVSVVGLAVSLAVQGSLSNVAGGIILLTTKPFENGDFIECAGNTGTVLEVNLITTKLMTVDNKKVFIPNSDISASRIINYSCEGMRRVDMNFTASYDAPTEKVKAAILEAVGKIDAISDTPAVPFVRVSNYLDSSIEYVVRVWTTNENYWGVYFDLMEGVRDAFEQNQIEMTYPHVNVHMMEK